MEKELFKKLSELTSIAKVEPVADNTDGSRLAQGTIIVGDISSKGDIRIDGHLDGKLYSEGRIVVGNSAVLKGSLVCSNVDFCGKLEGDIYVKDVLSVKGTAVINGDIHVRKLHVELGAQINGSCHMITEEDFETLRKTVVTAEIPEPVVVKKGGNSMKLPSAQEEKEKVEARFAARSGAARPVSRPSAASTASATASSIEQ